MNQKELRTACLELASQANQIKYPDSRINTKLRVTVQNWSIQHGKPSYYASVRYDELGLKTPTGFEGSGTTILKALKCLKRRLEHQIKTRDPVFRYGK